MVFSNQNCPGKMFFTCYVSIGLRRAIRSGFTVGIVCLVEVRKLGRVHCATLKSIKSAFVLGRRNTFFEMEKKLDYQERENEVSTL